jgi:hypothetical protein
MNNRTDSGIHFDRSTAQLPVAVKLDIEKNGGRFVFDLLIPLTIKRTLNTADMDACRHYLGRRFDEHCSQLLVRGVFDSDVFQKAMTYLLKRDAVEFLYNEFTLHQNRLGNQTWQTPREMQPSLGPSPDEDERMTQ